MERTQRPSRFALRLFSLALALAWCVPVAHAENEVDPAAKSGDQVVSGMSIVGNDEAPKSLVIVPWKSSDLGETLDVSRMMDSSRRPVDRQVFSRELDYYEIRTGSKP